MTTPHSLTTALNAHLQQAIEQQAGWIGFDTFMGLALYTPGLGYYANEGAIFGTMPQGVKGQGSDFVTAPEMSPFFGRALAARLQPEGGAALAPRVDPQGSGNTLSELSFAAPLPENTRFTLTLPAELRDEAGRALANAGSFPLTVATAGMPPLAKFAAAPFGVLEAGPQAMLPLTLRQTMASGSASTVSEMPAMVVIYDPSAGFVTGGGWINSPAGVETRIRSPSTSVFFARTREKRLARAK